jgi:tRNA (guanosine-2'-O-)-methyltransferase
MDSATHQQALINYFTQYLTGRRLETLERVLAQRTRHITLVLENIFQPHNISAVVRTSECMGMQDLHVVDNDNLYEVNKHVLKGSNKWIDIIRYKEKKMNNTERCFAHLKNEGYRILVTDPAIDGLPIHQIPIEEKFALVMGNEKEGASDYALQHADQKVHIPMVGFTESMNISVSAAICLSTLLPKLRSSSTSWQLGEEEKQIIRLQWLRKSIRRSDLIEQEYLRTIA